MKQVTSTARGVYLVHEEGQPYVEGVAVYHWDYDVVNACWQCEKCGVFKGTTRPDCEHIELAKKYKERRND